MKKMKTYIALLLCVFLLMACKKKDISIVANEVSVNTILIKRDGVVQSAIVEDFQKDYYSQTELAAFVDEHINQFNLTIGEGSVVRDDLEVKDQIARVVFTFADMKKYAEFNEVDAFYLTAEEARANQIIPDILVDRSSGESITKEEVLNDEKLQVVVVNEELDVIVDGRIKYYSNGIILNNTTVQSLDGDYTVVVFKP